jgi:TonB family protein
VGLELARCPEPVGWVGNRNIIVPPDITPVRRVSPIPQKKRTVCRPRPDGELICRSGNREWFSDRLFVESHTRDTRVAHGSSMTAHASCLIGLLVLIGQPAPATPARVSAPLRMPAFVAMSGGGGGSAPLLVATPSVRLVEASPAVRAVNSERPKKLRTVTPLPAPVAPERMPTEAPRPAEEEDGRVEGETALDAEERSVSAADVPGGGAVVGGAGRGDSNTGAGNGVGAGGVGLGVGGTNGDGVGDGRSGIAMAPGPYRVGNGIEPPRKIKDVRPVYPAGALASRALGTVLIEAVVGADGKVHDATVVHSIPSLDRAALDAVRQWEFLPSRLNGIAVSVVISVLVQFSIH